MHIVIAGLGVMGASLAMAIRQNTSGITIGGYDRPKVLQEALKLGIIDYSLDSWPDACRGKDLVILATPLRIIRQHLQQLNGLVDSQTVVLDVGSTKAELHQLVKEIHFSGRYVGGHPMTGAEKNGLKAANPLLYENAVFILTGVRSDTESLLQKKLFNILQSIKARVLLLDPEVHDKIMAVISHLPHILAISLINLVGARNSSDLPCFELAAGSFRDLTRIASSSYDIWEDIFGTNQHNIRQALQDMIELLSQTLGRLDGLQSDFQQANRYREQVPRAGKGFLAPLTDILVYVTDEVGVIAKIANALSAHDLDIRDIELLKIREKEGGVFRLSLTDRQQAEKAVQILNSINYQALIRE